ncbi:MAG: methionine--tRNA ligase [Elusimicrobiales bacterium]|nr:methionine--tRNA ligase [Elusimicrobiales bacterium]
MKKYYITTPLYYVNYIPHIGHAYTTIAADVLSRYMRSKKRDVFFQTGTDEHGINIERTAQSHNKNPKEWADEIVVCFKDMWKVLHIEYDYFIRTTDKEHEKQVQLIFEKLIDNGDIYKGNYEGLYCSSCENFYEESEIIESMCPIHKKPIEKISEETYFFKLSKYQNKLLDYYKQNPKFLSPSYRALEIVRFVEGGLKDISVSRTRVKWGIPVLRDPSHTIYVWFDALLNYITGPGYKVNNPDEKFYTIWPCDIHLIGKEIFRFHAVIWPAILMALELPLPKKVYAHGWWTVEGEKMSKSRGNIINPIDIIREYSSDVFRYFIFREVPFGQDGDFSYQALRNRYNSELCNGLGNLFSRVLSMVKKYCQNIMPESPDNSKLIKDFLIIEREIDEAMEELNFSLALDKIWKKISYMNKLIDEQKPWELAKTEPEKLKVFLRDMIWGLRMIAKWIYPFMPETSIKMSMYLAIGETKDKIIGDEKIIPLFPRKN